MLVTASLCIFRTHVCSKVRVSHNLIVPSPVPDASVLPSGESLRTTDFSYTAAIGGRFISFINVLVLISHTRRDLSYPPEYKVPPSFEKRIDETPSVWPFKTRQFCWCNKSQIRIVPSSDPDVIKLLFGENNTEIMALVCPSKIYRPMLELAN